MPAFAMLSGCGTTSSCQSAPTALEFVDLKTFDRLMLENFVDEATCRAKPEMQLLLEPKVARASTLFADRIVSLVQA